ncbi:MAG: hypothetical protein KDE47_02960 [Caldilineaceae bacterium]|nr:hypothetical protein [Caldilineaceae bacterium]MCB0079858.1 hypothetical protein [Caldilineaceae bacterium]
MSSSSDLTATLPLFLSFLLTLFALAWFSRQLSRQIQTVLVLLTRNADLTMVLLFLLLLPGVIIHEGAHWLTARLLGLKTGKFRVWPKKQGKHIGLGSVSVQRGNLAQDTLVGMAPLIAGSILVALIAEHSFHAPRISTALGEWRWLDGWHAFRLALQEPDGVLWAYLLFAISNAMMPSASDREPVQPLLLYTAVAIVIYILLGLPLTLFTTILHWLAPILQNLVNAFLFTGILDCVVWAVLYLITQLIAPRRSA